MNFEGLEQMRYENTKAVMEELVKVVQNPKIDIEQRLKAAKIVDGMSDSIIKAWLLKNVSDGNDDNSKRLTKQLGRLIDDKE